MVGAELSTTEHKFLPEKELLLLCIESGALGSQWDVKGQSLAQNTA